MAFELSLTDSPSQKNKKKTEEYGLLLWRDSSAGVRAWTRGFQDNGTHFLSCLWGEYTRHDHLGCFAG